MASFDYAIAYLKEKKNEKNINRIIHYYHADVILFLQQASCVYDTRRAFNRIRKYGT